MGAVNSQTWFEKHKGHNVVEKETKIEGLPEGVKNPLKDYTCMDCGKMLRTTQSPGMKPENGKAFGGVL